MRGGPPQSIVARAKLRNIYNETNDYESYGCNVRGDVRFGVVISARRV